MKARVDEVIARAKAKARPIKKWWKKKGKRLFSPIRLGDLERTTPFSDDFGADRGGAIDRVYIESFLDSNRSSIRGRVLEMGDDSYTRAFGDARVTQRDVFHVDTANTGATWVGDLSNSPKIPDGIYDCIVLTQTLQFIYDTRGTLRTCHRILKPGGTLLITAPGLSQLDRGPWSDSWFWSFTDRSLRRLLEETFVSEELLVTTYGNVYAAATFLYGLGAPEIKRELLEPRDDRYPVIVAVVARKASTEGRLTR